MPFSANNPNRNRNFVIAVMGGVFLFAVIMGVYAALALAGRDTDAFLRFLTLLVVTVIPSGLAAFRANTAANHAGAAAIKMDEMKDTLNGGLDVRIHAAVNEENREQTKREDAQNGTTIRSPKD